MILAASAALIGGAAVAQQGQRQGQAGMQHGQMAMQDYMKSMQDMHQKMMSAHDADPDRAFALKMIAHHQGGIDMARIVQQHGDDAEIKQMAQKGADMQRKEIAELQSWLDRHGGRTPRP
ncbi:MAG TPA: DUF305 domain-containing protein [Gemmatales bacterium]|nr:DUF305 domain-containing protein [Phenylobacterium sp.]HMP04294.1 DUF305 domain-containing protein [Gemmatales bacterium]